MKNIAFLPASDELRADLYIRGLDFFLVKIEGKSQFMIVTNQIRLIKELAREHNINEFHTSDSKRQLHKSIFMSHGSFDYQPFKLGQLTKDPSKEGIPFLVVTEDNATYHYIIK